MSDEFSQIEMAILRSAGVDPVSTSYSAFTEDAIRIFTQSYQAIFRVRLKTLPEGQDTQAEAHNAAVLVNALRANLLIRYPELRVVSVNALLNRDSRVLSVIMAALFQEGQRLWLEKLKKAHLNSPPKNENQEEPKDNLEDGEYVDDFYEDDEDTLPENEMDQSPITEVMEGDGAGNDLIRGSMLDERRPRRRRRRKFKVPTRPPPRARNFIAENSKLLNMIPRRTVEPSKSRPGSASNYRMGERQSDPAERKETPLKKSPRPMFNERGEEIVFTYDMRSGRRLALTRAQLDDMHRKRLLEKNGDVRNMSDLERRAVENKAKGSSQRTEPSYTRPSWPGYSTERSVKQWHERMRQHTSKEPKVSPVRRPHVLSKKQTNYEATMYPAYEEMEPLDLILSVEHCSNCEQHSISLRHSEAEYVNNADAMLRYLKEAMLSLCLSLRLGVSRFSAIAVATPRSDSAGSRIGAFEIQAAFKSRSNGLTVELLHSKLATMRWPSKSVMAKRLQAFLAPFELGIFPMTTDDGQDIQKAVQLEEFESRSGPGINEGPNAIGNVQWLFDAKKYAGAKLEPNLQILPSVSVLNGVTTPPSLKVNSQRSPRPTQVYTKDSAVSYDTEQIISNHDVSGVLPGRGRLIRYSCFPVKNFLGTLVHYPNGDTYEGETLDMLRHGNGLYKRANSEAFGGIRFEGSWNRDNRIGTMQVLVKNGDILTGDYDGENWNGRGTGKLSTGEIYEGQYLDGYYSGQGKLQLSNGDIFEGEFNSGLCTQGKLISTNGESFEGEFFDGRCWNGIHIDNEGIRVLYKNGEVSHDELRSPDESSHLENDKGLPKDAYTEDSANSGKFRHYQTELSTDATGERIVSSVKLDNYESMTLSIFSIELAGAALKNSTFDEVVLRIEIMGTVYISPSSAIEEARSDKRLILTDMRNILVTSTAFEEGSATLAVTTAYEEILVGCSLPLNEFVHPVNNMFEVSVPLVFEEGVVLAVLKCMTSLPKEKFRNRVREMDVKELVGIKFAPLLSSSQEDEDDGNFLTTPSRIQEHDQNSVIGDASENLMQSPSSLSPRPPLSWSRRSVRVKSIAIKQLLEIAPTTALCKLSFLHRREGISPRDLLGRSAVINLTFGIISDTFISPTSDEKGLWTSHGPDTLLAFDATPKLLKLVELEVIVQNEDSNSLLFSGSLSLTPLIQEDINKEILVVGDLRDKRNRFAASAIAVVVMTESSESPRISPRNDEQSNVAETIIQAGTNDLNLCTSRGIDIEAPDPVSNVKETVELGVNDLEQIKDFEGITAETKEPLPKNNSVDHQGDHYDEDYDDEFYDDDFENIEIKNDSQAAISLQNTEDLANNSQWIALRDFHFVSQSIWEDGVPLSRMIGVVTDRSGLEVTELNLGRKGIVGSLPPSINTLKGLTVLSLYGNKLGGSLPDQLFDLANLRRLNLYDNKFCGALSTSFSRLSALEILNLSGNEFSGLIPKEMAIDSLKELFLHQNQLSGPIPIEFANIKELMDMTSDLIPYSDFYKVRDWISAAHRFHWESPYEGEVSGRERETLDYFNETYRAVMAENESWMNWGTSAPPSSWRGLHWNKSGNIQCLVLRGCGLVGEIPTIISHLEKLVYLDLSKNSLVGDIPDEFSALKLLQSLHLDSNRLSGSLYNLPFLKSLKVLDIGFNLFDELPEDIHKLSVLETLRVNDNKLTGEVF